MRVLYVEDNRINAVLFQQALSTQEYVEVGLAEDGARALLVCRDWRPDVLVLDAQLPDTSGLHLLPALRTLPGMATVPAFMCSAEALDADVHRAFAAGFDGYWTKPVNFYAVYADLRRIYAASQA